MVRALIPHSLKPLATGSHDFRVVLHMCSKITPDSDFAAAKKVARSLVPSGEVMSTSLGGVWADANPVNNSRTERRIDRGMRVHLRIRTMPASFRKSD